MCQQLYPFCRSISWSGMRTSPRKVLLKPAPVSCCTLTRISHPLIPTGSGALQIVFRLRLRVCCSSWCQGSERRQRHISAQVADISYIEVECFVEERRSRLSLGLGSLRLTAIFAVRQSHDGKGITRATDDRQFAALNHPEAELRVSACLVR